MPSFQTKDGTTVNDGDEVTLGLAYSTEEVIATGKVRHFIQEERVYDDEGIAVGKTSEEHWELLINDPEQPLNTAIGFRPENVSVR